MGDQAAKYKKQAADAALELVESGMTLGLGTGSTAAFLISGLGERLADGRLADIRGVPTSEQTAQLARAAQIPLVDLGAAGVDLAIDGCDEVDPDLNLIKGLGGALTREKLVVIAAQRFVVIADSSKQVAELGELAPVPVEVLQFGLDAIITRLSLLGESLAVRNDGSGRPLVSDNGNLIVDLRPRSGFSPLELADDLKAETGVVDHGLFLGLADEAILAGPAGVTKLERP